jgi:carbon monoxide dehydrogenase subunit G
VAFEIRETFQVQAPIDTVWKFVMDPQQVVTCMPGAALDQVVDAQTFLGTVKVKVGAITATYKGRVQFTQIDHQGHNMQMLAEGRETGGGMAKGTMSAHLRALSTGQTEVVVEASVDLTGRLMQVGRGMIQGVARLLFQQFAKSLQQRLETPQAPTSPGVALPGGMAAVPEAQPIRIVPILLQTLWSAIKGFFRRLFGRGGH